MQVKELQPVVFVYSLNDEVDPSVFQPLVAEEGTLYRIVNAGREGAVYLGHIINYWNNLAGEIAICRQSSCSLLNYNQDAHASLQSTLYAAKQWQTLC